MTDAKPSGSTPMAPGVAPSARLPGPWFVIYTKPLRERATQHRITEEGGTAWLPLEPPPRRRAVERERLIRPLFPRYCFARDYPWLVVRNAGGEEMAQVLTTPNRQPLPLPAGFIETLMAQCGPNGVMRLPEAREVSRRDKVRVETGPFADFSGIVQRTTRDRIWILLTLLGRPTEVPFTRENVELLA